MIGLKPETKRRAALLAAVWLASLFLDVGWTNAQIIDRMVAVVNGQVVTQNDVGRHRDLARFFNDNLPPDEAGLLREVIEDLLIRDQIRLFPGIRFAVEDVDAYLTRLGDADDFAPGVVRSAARARLERAEYFDLRFRRFTDPSDEELIEYYQRVFLPEAEARGLDPMPRFDEMQQSIRESVRTETAEGRILVWVESLLRRSEIEVVE